MQRVIQQLFRAAGFWLQSNSLSLGYLTTHTTRYSPNLRRSVATAKTHHSISEWVSVYMCLLKGICVCRCVCMNSSDPQKRVKGRFRFTCLKENRY